MQSVHSLALTIPLAPAKADNWVTTWYASPQPVWDASFILPTNVPATLNGETVREIIKVSAGGKQIRLVFSNRYGKVPLVIGEVRIAATRDGAAIVPGTERLVTFKGQRSATIAPGQPGVSDPMPFELAPLERVTVTSFFPHQTPVTTFHWGDQQTAMTAAGNVANAALLKAATSVNGRLFLSALQVDAVPGTRTVVALGDSITDGNGSTPDANRRWPDLLAQRFAGQNVAIANAGISGARMLADGMGVHAMARFDQDVLAQPGAKTVILLMGINDIGWPGSPFAPTEAQMSADKLIAGYTRLIAKARSNKVRIIGATLLPFEGALRGTPFEGHYSPHKERMRQAVNQWIRSAGAFDAVVDFDQLLRDPAHPTRLRPVFDSGDHLHPGNAGYQAMANAFDLKILFGN